MGAETDSGADGPKRPLSVVGDDTVPVVQNTGSILELSRRFGELAPKLDVFSVNGDLVYYDHNRERKLMTGSVFRSWIEEKVLVHGRFDSKSGNPLQESLTKSDATDVLVAPAFLRGVREIKHEVLVKLPVIREDGNLELLEEGFDRETGVYTVPGAFDYDLTWDVAQAKEWFEKWFGAMPYEDDRSKAVMVAGLLLLYVQELPGGDSLRPGFLWEANRPGSGKSLCAKGCCSIVLGLAPVGKNKKREEMDKEIESHLRSKSPVIFLDNLYGALKNATLDQLITSKYQTFREMGGQKIVTMENNAPVLITGNDLEKNDDAWRRYLQCRLFEPGDPADRVVENLLDDDVMQGESWRRDALSSLWAFVRTWDEKGRPKGETTLGSFEAFSRLMGGIVTACGYSDPFEKPEDTEGMSPEQADFAALVRGLYGEMKEEGLTSALFGFDDMARMARSLDIFSEMVGDEEYGRREVIKRDKIPAGEQGSVLDLGYLTQQQLQPWAKLMRSKVGQETVCDGVRVRFGNQKSEKRKVKFTVEVV
jgi:hypothetical protein